MTWRNDILVGDCRALPLADCSVDAVVTDPPAGIGFMGKAWDRDKGGRDQWIAWLAGCMAEALRVLKPGGHALVWALPRTSHWTGMALEDAGFEVRDRLAHIFGQGFPKSLDVSKAIDTDAARQWDGWGTALKPAVEDWWLCRKPFPGTVAANVEEHGTGAINVDGCRVGCADKAQFPAGVVSDTEDVFGDGAGLYEKRPRSADRMPAGRWPPHLLLSHAPGCRRTGTKRVKSSTLLKTHELRESPNVAMRGKNYERHPSRDYAPDGLETVAAWECVDGCPVKALGEQSGKRASAGIYRHPGQPKEEGKYGGDRSTHLFKSESGKLRDNSYAGDTGTAARFFPQFPALYCPKASRKERNAGCERLPERVAGAMKGNEAATPNRTAGDGSTPIQQVRARNNHPTVKPVALMRWLCRLVTPPGGTVLDPFCGSGSTLVACSLEGFHAIGLDLSREYTRIARARARHVTGRMPLFHHR